MISLKKSTGRHYSLTSSLAGNGDESQDNVNGADDEFGMKNGGWCSFANSLPIVASYSEVAYIMAMGINKNEE